MQAKELMIGDWVNVAEFGIIDQVLNFTPDTAITGHGDTCGEYEYERLEPIPLTVDILTKNGFVLNKEMSNDEGDAYEFVESQDARAIVHDFESRHTHLFLFAVNFPMTIERLLVSHVHELQHALRLCGINKEIEL